MKRKDLGLAIVVMLFVAASAGFASGGRGTSRQNLTPSATATARGCRDGGVGNINRTNPSWVSVDPSDQARIVEGIVRKSKVTYTDFPTNHESHDWNYFVKLDPQYEFMNSERNHLENGERWMEMEWETQQFDMRYWPVEDDRTWTLGRWIFDCGHPPALTEIHPPKIAAFTRREPHIFRGDTAPSFTNKTFIWANPQGGYFYDGVQGVHEFDVPLPPRPSAAAVAFAEVVEVRPGSPQPQITLPVSAPRPGMAQLLNLNAQMFSSRSVPRSAFAGQEKIRVKYDLSNVSDRARWNLYQNPLSARPSSRGPRFGAIIAAGWREKPAITKGYRVMRVTFDSIKINEDHDPIASGEWRFWANANGNWFEVANMGDVDNGDTVAINKIVTVMVPDDGQLSVSTAGWESDPMDDNFRMAEPGVGSLINLGNLDENDEIGFVYKKYTAANNFGNGPHGDRSNKGDFQLNYRVEEIQRIAPGTPNGAGQPGSTGKKRVSVTFLSAKILDDSDGAFRGAGEIMFDFDVNGSKRRFPSRGHQSVDSGKTVNFGMRAMTVDLNPIDALRISVIGSEDDSPDQNDDLGNLILNFDRSNNFGAGTRTVRGPKKDGQFEVTIQITVVDIP